MSPRLRPILVVLLIVLLAGGFPAGPASAGPPARSEHRSSALVQRWIVQLHEPPLAQAPHLRPTPDLSYTTMSLSSSAGGRLQLDAEAATQYRSFLQQRQQQVFQTIQHHYPQAEIHRSYQIVFNGLSVALPGVASGDETALAQLRSLPGVANASPERVYEPAMYASLPQMNTAALWNAPAVGGQAEAGVGIKIAVIDTGINVNHPFFNPDDYRYPPGYPKGNTRHTTPKVIAARSYVRPDLLPLVGSETPQPGPHDSSHGTHIGGIVAGVPNTPATFNGVEQTISGVAPRAYLMNYKVFYANDSVFSGLAFESELIAALEDAVADGADVINNSWGGRANVDPHFDPIAVAANAAADAGVVVVFAAGNSGPSKSTVTSRDLTNQIIVVGASSANQTIAAGFVDVVPPNEGVSVPGPLTDRAYGGANFGPTIREMIGPAPYLPVQSLGVSSLGCDPLPADSLSGHIALIERGVCHFSLKAFHAQQAGAFAAIIYNSAEAGDMVIGMASGDRGDEVSIPAVMVPHSMGVGMIEWYDQHGAAAHVQIDPQARVVESTGDVLASFSSRGPTFRSNLKPDVVAPGINILSAGYAPVRGEAQHEGYGLSSGTSMAAPHVAGGVALLRQAHPEWSPLDIRSALMATAETAVWLDTERTEPASVLERGAGRVDLGRAVNPGLLFDNPALSFGRLHAVPGEPTRAEMTVQARNISGRSQTYTLSAEKSERERNSDNLTITVSPPTLTIGAGEVAQFTVSVLLAPDTSAGDYGGTVTLEGGPGTLHLPLWARLFPAEQGPKVLLIDNDGSSSLEFPDYADYYARTLSELAVPYTYLDVDALAPSTQTLPDIGEMQKHEIVLWFTGDNEVASGTLPVPTPLTEADQNILMAYMQSGGHLIATGQNLADASDIENVPPGDEYGRSELYQYYLGARFVQDSVFGETPGTYRVVGTTDQPWLTNIVLDLGSEESPTPGAVSGAGNQSSVDEIVVIDEDPRSPDRYTRPMLKAASPASQLRGIVGLNRTSDPTLENPVPAFAYRSIILSFGLEGVRNDTGTTTRKELLQSLLYWIVDHPTAQVRSPVVVSEAGQFVTLTVDATSNIPARFVRYRWDFGDGSPILTTEQPKVVHAYEQPGSYPLRVEVTDSWGHSTLAEAVAGDVPPPPAATEAAAVTFPETGQTLQGRFLTFWRQHGGLSVFGYPITPQMSPQNEEKPLSQVFERARFEYHPQHQPPYDVLLSPLGSEALAQQGRNWRDFPTVEGPPPGCLYFAETGHSLCPPFREYWEQHGLEFDGQRGSSFAESLALFGYPISEPQPEAGEDGSRRTVQWFERARFEHHPDNEAGYTVLLSRLGSSLYGGGD